MIAADYLRAGRRLAEGPRGWHWTFDAVTLWIGGRRHVLPPLYPVFLSIFASFPGLPLTALIAGTRVRAILWKIALHLTIDLLVIAMMILAPFGVMFARDRRQAAVFVLWICVNLFVASLGGFGGARLRGPFEPMLLVLASVVVVGDWSPSRYR